MKFEELLVIITALGTVAIVVLLVLGLIEVFLYESKINILESEKQKRIEEEKQKPVSLTVIDGRIQKIEEEFKPKIEEMERKRQFILDKLPFLRK